ncbi:hypothetical protein Rhopal_004295-T1 [Rhodotorula paludigena]|uniref:Laccase n=1 Tax=Rhodotorula paludigena TaxID=86838 RepID=A0AAV5GFF9_9BASI|nr:hypothetical protein Rhopal_004295-T1 [Rhodotorula paludigena]
MVSLGINDWAPVCCPQGSTCLRAEEGYAYCKNTSAVKCTSWSKLEGCLDPVNIDESAANASCCPSNSYCETMHPEWSTCNDAISSNAPTPDASDYNSTDDSIASAMGSAFPYLDYDYSASPSSSSKASHTPSRTSSSHSPSHTSDSPARPSVTSKVKQLRLSSDWNVNAPPQKREFWWEITERPGSPDGFHRPMLVVNGQYPGPLIEVNNGDRLVVHVVNSLDQPIAIHWHGLIQNGTNWEDGPSGVTQCPIPPYGSYTYDFPITGDLQYGTYWWHAHRRALYTDGVIGPLIVHSPLDPLVIGRDYDVDQIVTLVDWYHDTSDVIVNGLLGPDGYQGTFIAPSPNSVLINGHGIYNCSFENVTSACDQKNVANLPELRFAPDQRVRLRFIHMGAHPVFLVSVDKHELEVIEADDTPVFGPSIHRIPINVAQRYSAILDTTFDEVGDSYYLRAQVVESCLGAPFPDLDTQARMVIRIDERGKHDYDKGKHGDYGNKGKYDGKGKHNGAGDHKLAQPLPTSVDWNDPTNVNCTDLNEDDLSPRVVINVPRSVEQISFFNSSLMGAAVPTGEIDDLLEFTLNNITFENFAYNPILHQVVRGQPVDMGRVAIVESDFDAIDLVIHNLIGPDHPFHLHGQPMLLLARGQGVISSSDVPTLDLDITNPLRRDTITVPPGEWILVRVPTTIAGVFAFHCHIVWHQSQGLLGAVIAQPDEIRQFDIPSDNLALCNGGNPNLVDPGRRNRRALSPGEPALPTSPRKSRFRFF